uniref:Uncharacterized protein n=1 Tax=Alexandrium monilatum TaxID=311494 RepID=A0A7S4UH36_9DINO
MAVACRVAAAARSSDSALSIAAWLYRNIAAKCLGVASRTPGLAMHLDLGFGVQSSANALWQSACFNPCTQGQALLSSLAAAALRRLRGPWVQNLANEERPVVLPRRRDSPSPAVAQRSRALRAPELHSQGCANLARLPCQLGVCGLALFGDSDIQTPAVGTDFHVQAMASTVWAY